MIKIETDQSKFTTIKYRDSRPESDEQISDIGNYIYIKRGII